ncbi:FAD binding domain-containing protein [Streptomyces sp. NPDC048710]|uniref:FAD binding domain-containing protein n=1 Tax=unclassified Streptomyces TaxID=2593676 RepID=UPI00371B76C7
MLVPKTLDELHSALSQGGQVVGGGAGIMSGAMHPRPPAVAIDLSGLGLEGMDPVAGHVGAMVRLAALERFELAGRNAVAAAVAATASPTARRLITVGGVLGGRLHGGDLTPALAVHGACVQVLTRDAPQLRWLPLLDLADLARPFAVLRVTLGAAGPSAFRRIAGHQTVAPSLVSVAGLRHPNGTHTFCVSAATPRAVLVDAERLPPVEKFLDDHRASAAYRREMTSVLISQLTQELAGLEAA